MDINSNLEQINTFQGGMNTDTADFLLDPKLYRYAENLRFLTEDSNNTGELKTIEGYAKLLLFPEDEVILKTDSIRNIGVIITAKPTNVDGEIRNLDWKIYTIDRDNIPVSTRWKLIFGPCNTPIGSNISTVTRWETDKLVHLYIADGKQRTMSINLKHTDYDVDGFAPTDIKYLVAYSELKLNLISCSLLTGGSLKPAVVLYTYRLYKEGGLATGWAPFTKPLYITKDNGEGYIREEISDKAVKLNIDFNYDTQGLNRILIYRITYISSSENPDVYLIYDDKFLSNFEYIDVGLNIEQATNYDFSKIETQDKFIPKIIESKGDYLFSANIEDAVDNVDDLFKDIDFQNGHGHVNILLTDKLFYRLTKTGKLINSSDKDEKYVPSLMPGETYRYGIILYDDKGRRSSVKWVGDITVPYLNLVEIRNYTKEQWKNDNAYYKVEPKGIRVSVRDIPNCSGFEIVRCIRGKDESRTLYQGIYGHALHKNNSAYLPEILTKTKFYIGNAINTTIENLVLFSCPEYVYLPKSVKDQLSGNISMRLSHTYQPLIVNGPTVNEIEGILGAKMVAGESLFDLKSVARFIIKHEDDKFESYLSMPDPDDCNNSNISGKSHHINSIFLYPTSVQSYNSDLNFNKIKINNIQFVDSNSPEETVINENRNFVGDKIYSIGEYTYYNYYMQNNITLQGVVLYNTMDISAGGKFLLLDLNQDNISVYEKLYDPFDQLNVDEKELNDNLPSSEQMIHDMDICVANIQNDDYVGYGSTNYSKYYSFGNYCDYNNDDASYVYYIYDGDIYVNSFIFNHSHAIYLSRDDSWQNTVVYSVPIYSRINLLAKAGNIYPNISGNYWWYQDYRGVVADYNQQDDAYLYNAAYNSIVGINTYTPVYRSEVYEGLFDTRIKYAGPKSNGESFDSWLISYSSDTMDVDSRYGQITELKLFKDNLVFWLENATGIISSNERNIIQDVDSTQILLGTGDVMLRYDYISTEYGMRPGDFSSVQSNTTLYWWDGYKKEIIGYGGGREVIPMKKIKNVSNYINNSESLDKPCLMYDDKYSEVLFNVVEGGPIVYSELIQAFTSIYTIPLNHQIRFKDYNIIIGGQLLYTWNKHEEDLTPVLEYVVNKNNLLVKTFDTVLIGLNNKFLNLTPHHWNNLYGKDVDLSRLYFQFITKELYTNTDVHITSREYDYRFAIPRATIADNKKPQWGNRMRGKTMLCRLTVDKGTTTFAIQYINTKFRISYS